MYIEKTDLEKLLLIANSYFSCYCETFDHYVMSNEEIEEIEDTVEKELAKDLKETDEFLYKIGKLLEEEL